MNNIYWGAALTVLLAGCAGGAPLPGHNHGEGAVVEDNARPDTPAADLDVWRLKVAGAT